MELGYERRGAGRPLVLIHGLGGSRRVWEPVLDRVAGERDVIAVDMPGAGRSPQLADGEAPTPARLGEAIRAFCASIGVERPHLAGNSLGGWVALEIAKAGGAASVCAISPAGLWSRPLGERRLDSHRIARRLRPLLGPALASSRARALLLRNTVARPQAVSREQAHALIADWIDAPGYEAANRELRAAIFERPDLVTVPTTIAWGSRDRLVAAPRPARMPPGSRFVVLDGLGHTPTFDDPGRIAELLLEASAESAPVAQSS